MTNDATLCRPFTVKQNVKVQGRMHPGGAWDYGVRLASCQYCQFHLRQ